MVREGGRGGEREGGRERRESWRGGKRRDRRKEEMKGGEVPR